MKIITLIKTIDDFEVVFTEKERAKLEKAFTNIHCKECKGTLTNLCYNKDSRELTGGFRLFLYGVLYADTGE